MIKNRIKIMTGVCALLLAVGLNVRHALNDYGVKSVNLNIEALARTVGDGADEKICYFKGNTDYIDYYECESDYPTVGGCGNIDRNNKWFSTDRHVCN